MYQPWLEVTAHVRVSVPQWQHREECWLHWAVPMHGGLPVPEQARRFSPGLRAARPGSPPPAQQREIGTADEAVIREAAAVVWGGWRPEVSRHTTLGVVSSLDEDSGSFRRRCLEGFGEALRSGRLQREDAHALSGLADAIEKRALGTDECFLMQLRAGLAWYPEGVEPAAAPGDLMAGGGVRTPR